MSFNPMETGSDANCSRSSTVFGLSVTLDGEVLEVEKSLDSDLELGVLLQHGAKKLLHYPLLVEDLVAVEGHLLLQRGQAKGEVLDLLPETEGEVLPLLAQSLQRGSADAVDADARCGDGVPRLLGRRLVREWGSHLR
jgi:hypothetical protein